MNFIKKIFHYVFTDNETEMEQMSDEEYLNIFIKGRSKADIETTYVKAWDAKNFEIEHYWKRANYFWAFQVASFAGYFSVLNSKNYINNPEILFFVISIGIITSFAWAFTNKGSKMWQRHWEIHVDMLENYITGPLYKIVTSNKTYSVSKINEIVSNFVISIWLIMLIKYYKDILTISFSKPFATLEILSLIVTLYFVFAMHFGYGRGRFGERKVKFFKRKFNS